MPLDSSIRSPARRTAARALALVAAFAAAFTAAFTAATPVAGQATELGRQTLGRPYWHLFAAYAIVVLLIAGWVISIARRLGRVEQRLPDLDR